jgi:hypothetical protein
MPTVPKNTTAKATQTTAINRSIGLLGDLGVLHGVLHLRI